MVALGRKCLSLLLTVALLVTMVGTAMAETKTSGPDSAPFWDTYGTRYQESVDALYSLGVVSGYSDTRFAPAEQVTRAQMAAMVVRALGKAPAGGSATPFSDVPVSHWSSGVVALASELGIVKGDGNRFRPNDPVTYPQVVAMLLRAVGQEPPASEYPSGYVVKAKDLGLIDGTEWGLEKPATRGDVALMLYRTIFFVPRGFGGTLSQTVFVRPGSISIEPADAFVVPGDKQLSAKVLDWVGKELVVPVQWSVKAGNATINRDGVLTTKGTEAVTVEARSGSLAVTKTFGVLESISAKADALAVQVGETVKLTAVGHAVGGNEAPVTPVWRVVSGKGAVTADGQFTPSASGSVVVRATLGNLSADVTIAVVAGIQISPKDVVTAAGRETQFKATAVDASGVTAELPVTWSVTGAGTIDQSGKFVAGNGPATITAKSGSLTASTTVQVIGRVGVTPTSATMKIGEAKQFGATVYSSANQGVPANVTWSVEPAGFGIISTDGRFFAKQSGTGYVVANYGGVTAKAQVTVAGAATGIRVSSSLSNVPANGSTRVTITATLIDSSGQTASGVDTILFTTSSTKLGTLDQAVVSVVDGVATANLTIGTTVGSYTVMASAPGTTLASAYTTIVTSVPAISYIQLETYPNPVAADGASRTTITATLYDTTGQPTVNNTANPISVYLNPSNGVAGHLNSSIIQIPVNQKSGNTYFISSATPGSTMISGSSNYSVRPTTVNSQVVGGAYRLKLRPVSTTAAADGSSELVVYAEVQDANGNVRTSDNTIYVSLSAVSGSNTLNTMSQTTSYGVATFRLKTTKAGTYDVNVWASNQSLQGDSTQVTFTAGLPYKLTLSIDPSANLAADGRTNAILRAKILDSQGNQVTNATNQVSFIREATSQGVTNTPSVTSANALNGEATLTITTTTGVGTDYYHVEASGLIKSTSLPVSTRMTGYPVKLSVLALQEPTITAGGTTVVRVAVFDQMNQIVTGDNSRLVTLMGTNGATVSAPTATVNGVATFNVSSTKAGAVGLTASADLITADLVGRVLNISPGAPDHVELTASPSALSADVSSRSYITASVVDRFGNVTGNAANVVLTASTGEYLKLSSTWLSTSGNVMVSSKGVPGTTTITGVAGSYVVTPITISTYFAGQPAKVVVEPATSTVEAGVALRNQVVVRARIVDENGNQVTSLSTGGQLTAMALQLSGSAGTNSTNISQQSSNTGLIQRGIAPNGVNVGSATVSNGMAQFTVTNTKAETITMTPIVFYNGSQLPAVAGTMTTTAGPASKLTLTGSTTVVPAGTATTVSVTASVTDVYGNQANTTNDTINFTVSGNVLSSPSQAAVPTSNGTATTTMTSYATTYGGNATVTATSTRLGISGTLVIAADRVPDRPTVTILDSSGNDSIVTSSDAGARVTVTTTYRYSPQQVMVYVNNVSVPLYTDTTFTIAADPISSGATTFIGYIRYADLGGVGTKDVRAVVQTPLGLSPLSDGVTLTVR